MNYTKESLIEALCTIIPRDRWGDEMLPRVLSRAIEEIFINKIPNNPSIEILRHAARDLHVEGYFKFS